jgi:hypothetical protein
MDLAAYHFDTPGVCTGESVVRESGRSLQACKRRSGVRIASQKPILAEKVTGD